MFSVLEQGAKYVCTVTIFGAHSVDFQRAVYLKMFKPLKNRTRQLLAVFFCKNQY